MGDADFGNLTSREAAVLELVAHGLSNGQVGDRLEVTIHAVKFHLASIYRKLGVANRTEAAALFFQQIAPVAVESARARDSESRHAAPLS